MTSLGEVYHDLFNESSQFEKAGSLMLNPLSFVLVMYSLTKSGYHAIAERSSRWQKMRVKSKVRCRFKPKSIYGVMDKGPFTLLTLLALL